ALTLLVFAGHPESLFHVVMFGCAYGVFLLATLRRNTVRALLVATSAGVVTLLLTAITLLPFLAAAPQSSEYVMRHGYYRLMPLQSDAKLVARRAGTAFLPFYGGSAWRGHATNIWDTGAGRVGSIIFALAAAGIIIAPRRRESWFFFIAGLICLAAHFEAPPVAQILHKLPLFDIALNDRLSFAAAFAFSLLSAFAADAWQRRSAIAIAIVATALAIATALVWKSQLAAGVEASLIASTAIVELLPLVIIAILVLRVPRSVALPIVLALLCAQRVFEDGGNYPALPRSTFFPRTASIDAMKAREPFRIVGVGATLIPNTSAMYGLEDARGYEAMTFSRLDRTYDLWCVRQAVFFNRVDDLSRPFLSAMNVRFALAPRSLAPPDGWRVVVDDRNSRVLENMRVLPRVFVPRVVHVRNNDEAVLAEMSVAKDFANDGWLMTPLLPPHDQPSPRATIVTKRRGSRYEIHTSYDADGWLFITESNWKGWRVTVDGQRVGTAYANQAFIGVAVAKGEHVVRAEYMPRELVTGRWISGVTLLALVLTLIGMNLRFSGPKFFAR
ncbi:MAG TPA: YfhO family protein, partial [Thermoanaerobaculia bacterium]|nr:YfhO family protein [Thermoanaerobaculia bacterium]